jgi:hypothetical protein
LSTRIALLLLALGVVVAAWQRLRPAPSVRIPKLEPPRPVRVAAASDGGVSSHAAEDEPAADDAPPERAPTELPEHPGRRDFEASMARVKHAVGRCQSLEQVSGTVTVRLVIGRSGGVQSAVALPPYDRTRTGECVVRAVKQATFPRFRGEPTPTVELIYPFYFRDSNEGVL